MNTQNEITQINLFLDKIEDLNKYYPNLVKAFLSAALKYNSVKGTYFNTINSTDTISNMQYYLTVNINGIISTKDDYFQNVKNLILNKLSELNCDVIFHNIQKDHMNNLLITYNKIERGTIKMSEQKQNYQECANLEVEDVYSTSKNTLSDLYNLQKDIQENVYGYDFKALQEGPLNEMREFFDWNYHAIQDELREIYNALGGIKDGIGNGVWKPWKKSYKTVKDMTYANMSESDKLELKYELIDTLHFLFNMMLATGIDEKELMNLYYSKNKENRVRQLKGY